MRDLQRIVAVAALMARMETDRSVLTPKLRRPTPEPTPADLERMEAARAKRARRAAKLRKP